MWIHFIQVLFNFNLSRTFSHSVTRNRKLGFRLLLGRRVLGFDGDGPIVARLEAQ